jgi:hypothetical protein
MPTASFRRYPLSRTALSVGLTLLLASAAGAGTVSLEPGAPALKVEVVEPGPDRIVIEYGLGEFSTIPVEIDGATHHAVRLGGESNSLVRGLPDLPNVARSVVIPDDAEMSVRVLSSHYVEFPMDVAPARGEIERTLDPSTVPYEFGSFYETDAWFPDALAEARDPYILRDVRGMVVVLNPFRYNPASGTLRVYDRVTLEVVRKGPGRVNVRSGRTASGIVPEFAAIYERHFLNYDGGTLARYTSIGETGRMLVISYGDFMAAMEPFVDWKNQMGIPCEMVSVTTAGGTAAAIAEYIQDYYDAHDLAFVLLVGDADEVPSLTANGGTSDPSFSLVAGFDVYPDIFVGRFSAETVEQVATQVQRSIEYEMSPEIGGHWYHRGTGIASIQGPGDDGEYDDEHVDNLREDLLSYGYSEVDQIYDPSANPAMVAAALNAGRGIVNYTGHGSFLGWGSSDFASSDVNALTNDNMLPFIWSVACANGMFSGRTCFAEAWVRATNGGEPTGAVAVLMSSINQDWDEPMDAQDEMVDLLVAGAKRTFGGLSMNGSCHMLDEYGPNGEDDFLAWHIFGDPSLRVRTDTPAALSVSHADSASPSQMTFDVTVDGTAGALCALSHGGVTYGSAFTDEFGSATIDVAGTLPPNTDATLTVTAFDAAPYIATVGIGQAYAALAAVSPSYLSATLEPGEAVDDWMTVGNEGEPQSALIYSVAVSEAGMMRQEDDSSMTVSPAACEPGATVDLVFTLSNESTDGEWMKGATLDFPEGVVVNSCADFAVSDRALAWGGATGDGARVTWAGDWWNVVYPGEAAQAVVNVTVDAGITDNVRVIYGFEGDGYGEPPHSFSGTLVVDCGAPTLFSLLSPNGNEAWGIGESRDVTWEPSGAPILVDISCSVDGGATWSTVVSGTEDDGVHTWDEIDVHVSDNCLMMISLPSNPEINDVSDASFSIFEPVEWLSIAPDGGTVAAGEVDTIDVYFDSEGMSDGDYYADLVVTSNGGSPVVVPVTLSVSSVGVDDRIPRTAVVYGNYPNPFWPTTGIAFSVPGATRVRLSVFSVDGRLVRTLTDEVYGGGRHTVPWDGRNASGDELPAGVYFYRFEGAGEDIRRKMVLLK